MIIVNFFSLKSSLVCCFFLISFFCLSSCKTRKEESIQRKETPISSHCPRDCGEDCHIVEILDLNTAQKKNFKSKKESQIFATCSVKGSISGKVKITPFITIGPGEIDTVIYEAALYENTKSVGFSYEPIDENILGYLCVKINFQ